MAGMLPLIAHAGTASAPSKSASALVRNVHEFIRRASKRTVPDAAVLLLAAIEGGGTGDVPSPAYFQFTQEIAGNKEKTRQNAPIHAFRGGCQPFPRPEPRSAPRVLIAEITRSGGSGSRILSTRPATQAEIHWRAICTIVTVSIRLGP